MYNIYRAVENRVKANSWILANESKCVLIDTNINVIELLYEKNLKPEGIFLTHEHYDHCEGLDIIRDEYNIPVIASFNANKAIVNAKKNMSLYVDGRGFTTKEADIIISDNCHVNMLGTTFSCLLAKGHSCGGMVIIEGNNVFTGDTILNNKKTPTRLPTGSKEELLATLTYLEEIITCDMLFYPGHGEAFSSVGWDKLRCI